MVVVLALACALLCVAALLWPRTLVMSLPFLVTLNGVTVPVGGSSLRLDQLVACVLILPLGASALAGARRIVADPITCCLVGILILNVVASLLNSPSRSYSLLQCANLASAWVIYVILINFLDTPDRLTAFFNQMLRAAVVASVVGIAAYVLALLGFHLGGAEVSKTAAERLTVAYGAYGTMVEPNIFGSFTGAHLVLASVLLMSAASRYSSAAENHRAVWVAVWSAVGVVLSFTRAAWLGVVAGLAAFVMLGGRLLAIRIRRSAIVRPFAVVTALAGLLLAIPGDAGRLFRFKLLNLVNVGSQTAVLRLITYTLGLQQSLQHPVIGWGTFTFAPLVAQGADFQQFENWRSLWIGNYLILAMHDTGAIGLALWCVLLSMVVVTGIRTVRWLQQTDPAAARRALSITVAVVSLLVPFLATTGFSLGYPWLLIGVLGAYHRLARPIEAPEAPPEVPQAVVAT